MAQTGFTPLLIYSSSTGGNAPTAGNLLNNATGSELAINIADGKLFYKDSGSSVQVIAWKTTPTTAGGTGLTSWTAGDLPYYASGTTLSKLGIGTSGYFLVSSGTAPQWTDPTTVAVTSISFGTTGLTPSTTTKGAVTVAGTLATSNGGTGLTGFTAANNAIYSTSSSALTAGTLPVAAGGTGLTSLTAGYIPYGNGTSAFSSSSSLYFSGTNLGIGTTTNQNVSYGAVNVTTSAGFSVYGGASSIQSWTGTTGQEGIWFNSTYFRLYSSSGVGVYLANGGTAWIPNASDERLKNKVSDINNALDAINKLHPLSYFYKNEPQTGTPRYGHFAQDVGNVIPDAMLISPQKNEELGDIYTYDSEIINVYLVKAVQELSAAFNAYVAAHP